MKHEKKYTIDTEELAVPEIHTNGNTRSVQDERDDEKIVYEPLAVPEIHIKKMKVLDQNSNM